MLRITRRNRQKISNRLAIFAGLMLLVSSLAGMQHASQPHQVNPENFVENGVEVMEQNGANSVTDKRAGKKKGFKVSLFLFRLD